MGTSRAQFVRQYRAALLDYLLGSGELGRARAYLLGRRAVGTGLSLLQIVRIHQDTAASILDATRPADDLLFTMQSTHEFLLEVLAPYEMAWRGYVDIVRAQP